VKDSKKETTMAQPNLVNPLGPKKTTHPMTIEIDTELYDKAAPIREAFDHTWREIVENGIRNYIAKALAKPAVKLKKRRK
jgi:hypothetical protein